MKKLKYKKQIMELIGGYTPTCPECNRGSFEYSYLSGGYWQCLWNNCLYINREIPSPSDIREALELEKKLEFLKQLQYLRKHYKYKPNKKYEAFRKSLKPKVRMT